MAFNPNDERAPAPLPASERDPFLNPSPKLTIQELEQQLAAARVEADRENAAKRALAVTAWNEITHNPENFDWAVKPASYKRWMWNAGKDQDTHGVSIQRRLSPAIVEAFQAVHGNYGVNDDYTVWRGMFYFRTDENILTHDGGGTCVLRDPMLCSDAEWAEIVAGRIPAKYKR